MLSQARRLRFRKASGDLDPNRLANACKSLLAGQQKEPSVLLLLPPKEFVATRQAMPGIGKDNLVSALKLQSESLLPTVIDSVALAVNPDSAEEGGEHIALWITDERLMQLFNAFQQQDIFLVAIKPRVLNIEGNATNCFVDEDQSCVTAVNIVGGVIANWWHVNKLDFENETYTSCSGSSKSLRTTHYRNPNIRLSRPISREAIIFAIRSIRFSHQGP